MEGNSLESQTLLSEKPFQSSHLERSHTKDSKNIIKIEDGCEAINAIEINDCSEDAMHLNINSGNKTSSGNFVFKGIPGVSTATFQRIRQNVSVDVRKDVCSSCHKKVYPTEKAPCSGALYHKSCFRCHGHRCDILLTTHSYHLHNGAVYCIKHVPKP